MLVAFSVAPSGGDNPDASLHEAVAAAVRVVRESGLPNHTDAMFTTIEGEWDEVMDVVKRATEAVGAYGTRVSLVLKADIRPGHSGELTGKVARVEATLAAETKGTASDVTAPDTAEAHTAEAHTVGSSAAEAHTTGSDGGGVGGAGS